DELVELAQAALASPKTASARNGLRFDLATLLLEEPPNVDAAISTLTSLLADNPDDSAAKTLLSEVLEREGRNDELIEILTGLLAAVPRAERPEAHVALAFRLGGALERAGRGPDAARVYERLAKGPGMNRDDLRKVVGRLEALRSEALADRLEQLAELETGPPGASCARPLRGLR